jgi:hypothetical protein
MLYAGLDLSRKRLDFHLLDAAGATVDVGASPPDADGLRGLSERLDRVGFVNSVIWICSGNHPARAAELRPKVDAIPRDRTPQGRIRRKRGGAAGWGSSHPACLTFLGAGYAPQPLWIP